MIAFLMAVAAQAATPSAAPQSQIGRLGWLIGEWEFADRAVSGNYEERGTRSCAYVLDDQYIRCESHGTSRSGQTRSYVFYLNHNPAQERFEMLSMWANVPHKALQVGSVSEDGRTIELLAAEAEQENGQRRRGWARISYDGSTGLIWESGTVVDGAERGPARYIDNARRRTPA